MASDRVKVIGYAQRVFFDQGIEYRNYSDELVGQQQTTGDGEGLPYSLANIFDTEFSNERRITRNYITNGFSQFITLADIDLNEIKLSELIGSDTKLYLNLDETKLSNYSYFGSFKEFLRVSLENIILTWPASIFVNTVSNFGYLGNQITVEDYSYDQINNIGKFKVNVNSFTNPYAIDYLKIGTQFSGLTNFRSLTIAYANTGITYGDYNISAETGEFNIIAFTGATNLRNDYVYFKVAGNPFSGLTGMTGTSGSVAYHIKPNKEKIERFFNSLGDFESNLLNRYTVPKYKAKFKLKKMHDSGAGFIYVTETFIWPTSDGYNLDYESAYYTDYVSRLIELADEMDETQTDILTRFLVSESITSFDSIPTCDGSDIHNEGQKITKTLRIYGREFDEIKKYIDGIEFAHTISYDKKDNAPDALIKNIARLLGWDLTNTIMNSDLLTSYMSSSNTLYSGHSVGMSAFEAELEFWRRLILNSPWIWKSKGTRKAVEFLIKFIGTPQGLIDFNEYVYVAQNQIDMDSFYRILIQNTGENDINYLPISNDGYPSPLPDNKDLYFQKAGLWYRETAGSGATLDKLIGNNPHIGPYDGGSEYMNQFNCLIPNFTGATLIQETVITATTNLFTNYNSGTFNDIFSYDAMATCSIGSINFYTIYQMTRDECIDALDIKEVFAGTLNDCAILGDWSVNLYIDGNLVYEGPTFYKSSGYSGDYPPLNKVILALTTAAQNLGLEVIFEGKYIHFVQKSGFGLCEAPNLLGSTIGIDFCLDFTFNCTLKFPPDTFTGRCKSCYTICDTQFEEVGTNAEIYIDVFNSHNMPASDCYDVTTEGIIDPFPAPKITDCGCDESGCDNALRICIKEKGPAPNTIDDCGINGFSMDEDGLVVFNINGQTTHSISPKCCSALGFIPIYNSKDKNWECRWTIEIIPPKPPILNCNLEIYSVNSDTGLVTFLQDGKQITVTASECCKQFGFTAVSVGDGYNCFKRLTS